MSQEPLPQPLQLPKVPTPEWVAHLQSALLAAAAAEDSVHALAKVLPAAVLTGIITKAAALVKQEPTLLELNPGDKKVTVVGDTHGHFQDLCHLFDTFGAPSSDRIYIFNGDFVDRGSWGVELLTLLMAYKWLLPRNVFLVRGNHEGAWCTTVYGFKNELYAKYPAAGKALYKALKQQLFASLPLAALVASTALILHGGLFRVPPARPRGSPAIKNLLSMPYDVQLGLGTLDDLRAASKGSADPDPDRYMSQLIASDVLWSDPSTRAGLHPNDARGVGTTFGPDITETFLAANSLKLIIRSHEGPDARDKRPAHDRMPDIDSGYAVDHIGPSGQLVTLFSAPRYPLFMPRFEQPYDNKGAVLHLTAPDYCTPAVESFEAVFPRPSAVAFYMPGAPMDGDSYFEEESEGDHTEASGSASGLAWGSPKAAPGCSTPSSKEKAPHASQEQPPQQEQQQNGPFQQPQQEPQQPSPVPASSHGQGNGSQVQVPPAAGPVPASPVPVPAAAGGGSMAHVTSGEAAGVSPSSHHTPKRARTTPDTKQHGAPSHS